MVLPMNGCGRARRRPSPRNPLGAALCMRRPMSCTRTAARSCAAAVSAILNLRGRKENSGCRVRCWRSSSAQMRASSISSGATPAH